MQPEPATGSSPQSLSAHDVVQDLRGPLTSLLAAADLLAAGEQSPQQLTHVGNVRFFAQRLNTALNDLDDLEQLVRGTGDRLEDTFDLPQLVRSCAAEIAANLESRAIELRVDVAADLPRWVQGDPARLRQLLSRLLDLATQHCTIGPVDLTVAADAATLRISILHRDPNCRLDGGVSAALCQHLTAFLRGELSMGCRADNTGLGMLLTLPRTDAPSWEVELLEEDEAAHSVSRQATPQRLTGSVLLVEDEPDHMLLIARLLAQFGAQVTTAGTANVAMHLLDNVGFDLILLDMATPGMDSFEAVRELRHRNLATPVLALTAGNSAGELEHCLAAGCNGCVTKPIDPGTLMRSLSLHLRPTS